MSEAQTILESAKGLFERGDRGGALSVLKRLESAGFNAPDPIMLGAYASFQLGDAGLAERLMRRVVAAHPGLSGAHHNLAKVLLGQGRLAEAAEEAGRAVKLAPGEAAAHETLAVAMERLGRPDKAEEAFRQCLAADPDNPALHDNLGRMLEKQAKDGDALSAHRRALELDPRHAPALFNIGHILMKRELFDDAERYFRDALAIDAGLVPARNNLGMVLQQLGRLDEAALEIERAAADTTEPTPYYNLAALRLEQDDPRAAIAACDAALARQPSSNTAMSLKAIGLAVAGDLHGARYYNDINRFLHQGEITGFEAHGTLQAFNAALFDQVSATPDRYSEPGTEAARQTRDLFQAPTGALATFRAAIDGAVAAYAEALGTSEHPFVAARPRSWQLAAWGTIVRSVPGDETTPIHPHAWLSGVYYARIPDEVDADPTTRGGCIEFGRPPKAIHHAYTPEVTVIQPREGLLILFPSYFYHRILPFRTARQRMSLAFDAVPA